jgi:phosphoserine phosphatase RsbU/P
MKLERRLFLLISIIALFVDFFYLVIYRALAGNSSPSVLFHTVFLFVGLAGFVGYLLQKGATKEIPSVHLIGRIVILGTVMLLIVVIIEKGAFITFDGPRTLLHRNYSSLIASAFSSIATSLLNTVIFLAITKLIFVKRRRTTKRNFYALLVTVGVFTLAVSFTGAYGTKTTYFSPLSSIAFGIAVIAMIVNAFRFAWILSLSKTEKLAMLALTFFGFIFFVLLSTFTIGNEDFAFSLASSHPSLWALNACVFLFAAIYLGIACISTLLHLPTATEFDRRRVEISSLQNMSRLVTEVFDFDELALTATQLALDITEGHAAWLEIMTAEAKPPDNGHPPFEILSHSLRNISIEQIRELRLADGSPVQTMIRDVQLPVIVQDCSSDPRLRKPEWFSQQCGSLALIPLTSHGKRIGLLGIVNKNPYEFEREGTSVLLAFSDMVAIALENSRLIKESLVKERMAQELRVAQDIQQSLLPNVLPLSASYDIAASSLPANEVGGDYYDVVQLDDRHIGIIVGDVSGKGVSAALYMAQVKGIFQSLCKDHRSTKELLVRMNTTLCSNMEKKSFISLLYAILDMSDGTVSYSRAGHCPLLYISDGATRYLRPDGMGVGLDKSHIFSSFIKEETLQLKRGDIIVLYSDGVTEARSPMSEEFDYHRLAHVVEEARHRTAEEILRSIQQSVTEFTGKTETDDDITLVVLRWKGVS